jgi:hypothetical protein
MPHGLFGVAMTERAAALACMMRMKAYFGVAGVRCGGVVGGASCKQRGCKDNKFDYKRFLSKRID